MRIEQTPNVSRSPRAIVDRPATLRDPARSPIDVGIEDLSVTGALLTAADTLPVGTLISLGIAGAGIHLARVVRTLPTGMAIEFMLPLEPGAVARAKTAEALVSVAFPQMIPPAVTALPPRPVDPPVRTAATTMADAPPDRAIDPRFAGLLERPLSPTGWRPSSIGLIALLIAGALLILMVI